MRRFPNLVPDNPESEGAALSRRARDWFVPNGPARRSWPSAMNYPILGPPVMRAVARTIRDCPPPYEVAEGGHFVQEWGEDVDRAALEAP